jgi:hypothetical protein
MHPEENISELVTEKIKRDIRTQTHISMHVPLSFRGRLAEGLYPGRFVFAGECLPVRNSTQSITSSEENNDAWREARCNAWTDR